MIYPSFKPYGIEVDWKEFNGVHGTIQIVDGLVVLRTDDHKLIVIAESPDLGKACIEDFIDPCTHKWVGKQFGGHPADAESTEWICYCDVCGIEKTNE